MGFFNSDDIVPDVNFGQGFLVANEVTTMDIPHIHDGACNFFVFTGAELDKLFEAEFEVTMLLGDSGVSMEAYKITTPSIVCIPPGVFHCPIYYKKVVRGVNTMMMYTGYDSGRVYPRVDEEGKEEWVYEKDNWKKPCIKDPEKDCTYCGLCFTDANSTPEKVAEYMAPFLKNAATTTKYKDCIKELRKDYHKISDAVISPRAVFKGKVDMEKTGLQYSFNIITKPCTLGDEEPFSNGQIAEFLWFSGADTVEPWSSFDAELEVLLGPDPEHLTAITVKEPGVVAVPPGTWRGPITVKKAGKPILFIPYYTQDSPRYKITQKIADDGKKVLVFDDETTIKEPTAGDELYLQIKR
jgi:hypothetical protein